MRLAYDPEKRARTLAERGLDFEHAAELFARRHYTGSDDRRDYGEHRWISVGLMAREVVVVVWTERDGARRIISIRKADRDERKHYAEFLDRP